MHVYSVNNDKRRIVNTILAAVYILVSAILEYFDVINRFLTDQIHVNTKSMEFLLLSSSVKVILPVSLLSLLYWSYDHLIWRLPVIKEWHGVPDLNGRWEGEITSPLKQGRRTVKAEIKQTWNRMLVKTVTNSVSSSQSAMIEIFDTEIWLRYSFTTVREGEMSYIGYNRLRYEAGRLEGEYFTAKNLPGEPGKGSKGRVCLKRSH